MIIEFARENGYYDTFRDNLSYRLVKSELTNNKWCIMKGHYSGRDFYKARPIETMDDEEIEKLKLDVFEDMNTDFNEKEFNDLFEKTFKNTDAIEELKKAGYGSTKDKDDFMENLRDYVDETIFQTIFNGFCEENLQ